MLTATLLAASFIGQVSISTGGTLEQVRYRFFQAVMEKLADEYDAESVTHGVGYIAQGHILFPMGRANRMYFFEHMASDIKAEDGWFEHRLKAFELKNGEVKGIGVWAFPLGKTKHSPTDGTMGRFMCLDRPRCKLPEKRDAVLQSILGMTDPLACYQYEGLNGIKVSYIDRRGVEHEEIHADGEFPMSKLEKRHLRKVRQR